MHWETRFHRWRINVTNLVIKIASLAGVSLFFTRDNENHEETESDMIDIFGEKDTCITTGDSQVFYSLTLPLLLLSLTDVGYREEVLRLPNKRYIVTWCKYKSDAFTTGATSLQNRQEKKRKGKKLVQWQVLFTWWYRIQLRSSSRDIMLRIGMAFQDAWANNGRVDRNWGSILLTNASI